MPTAKEKPSVGVTKSELMVFTDVPVQMSVEESLWETVKCQNLSPLDHRAPLEFHVSDACYDFYVSGYVLPRCCRSMEWMNI